MNLSSHSKKKKKKDKEKVLVVMPQLRQKVGLNESYEGIIKSIYTF